MNNGGGHMDFSQALQILKEGKTIAREKWDKGNCKINFVENTGRLLHDNVSSRRYINIEISSGHIAMKKGNQLIGIWSPLTIDILAEDWYAIEENENINCQ
jgi:hypothetical protein